MLEKFKDIRIGVIVALAEEYEIFCRYFHGKVVEKFHVGDLTIDILEREDGSDRIGLACVNRMGNVAAAVAATRLLEVFDLDFVVNIGLAAGVDREKQALGDITIAEKIRYYETGKMKDMTFDLAPEFSDLRSSLIQVLQTSDLRNWPLGTAMGGAPRRVTFGTFASGEKVIANERFVRSLLSQDRKTIAIEMESYGIAAAVHGKKEKLILIRGISDFADGAKNDVARLNAMEGAMRFFNEALRRGLFRSSKFPVTPPRNRGGSQPYTMMLTGRVLQDGVANNYIQISRTGAIDTFRYRKTIIQKMATKFSMGELRVFCIQLKVDFDEIRGETKTEKAAGILDFIERKNLCSLQDLDALIDGE